MGNRDIARKLLDYAHFLEAREANLYRVRAYRRAAETVLALDEPLTDIVATVGRSGLEELPGIGRRLSYTLEELACTGEFRALDAEDGQLQPEKWLRSLPGIGPHLARLIHERLGIKTLEELEQAAHDGRLTKIGVGSKRLRGIRDALAGRLNRYRFPRTVSDEPPVADLLKVDQE
jgi:DNA polymerase (family 10)